MKKIDFKKELGPLYKPASRGVEIVEVPEMPFLMIDGCGDPNTSREYGEAVEALFALSYTLKFMIKKGDLAVDYGVMPLEGLWWVEDMAQFDIEDKSAWQWTSLIQQPEFVTRDLFDEARDQAS